MNCKMVSFEEERFVYLCDLYIGIIGYLIIFVGDFRWIDDGEGGSEIYLLFLFE